MASSSDKSVATVSGKKEESSGSGAMAPVPPHVSRHKQQMTIAGSFLDFALFVADVEHFKFVLDAGKENIQYYYLLVTLLCTSLVLQVSRFQPLLQTNLISQLVVVGLLLVAGFRKPQTKAPNGETGEAPKEQADLLNYIILGLVTFIAIINVFITVFGDRMSSVVAQMRKHDHTRNITTMSIK